MLGPAERLIYLDVGGDVCPLLVIRRAPLDVLEERDRDFVDEVRNLVVGCEGGRGRFHAVMSITLPAVTSSGSTLSGLVVTMPEMADAYLSVLDEWCSHCGRSVHDEERAAKAIAEAAAVHERLLSSDEAETLRRTIGVAWGEGEIEDAEATALYVAVTRATRS